MFKYNIEERQDNILEENFRSIPLCSQFLRAFYRNNCAFQEFMAVME